MKSRYIEVIFFLAVLFCSSVYAQLSVQAPSSAYTNEGFRVNYSVSGSERPSNFVPPTVSGGRIVAGPYTSSSSYTSNINGKITHSQNYTFSIVVQASKQGTVTISPAQVKVGDKVYNSQPVSVKISDNGGSSRNYNSNQYYQRQTPQTHNQTSTTPQQTSVNIDNSALFIRAIPNKTNVVLGEEVVISYKLYTLVPVSEYSIAKIPSTNGFWIEELDKQESPTLTIEEHNGQKYQVAILRKVIVYPQKTGVLNIQGLDVNIVAHIATHSRQQFTTGDPFFDRFLSDPFFSRMTTNYQRVDKKIKTNPISITVNELPKPLPNDWSGAVGNFELSCKSTTEKIKAFDAFYLTYTLSGNGNLTLINSLPLHLPDEFIVSDAEITDNIQKSSSGLSGSRTFKYLVIPSVEGRFTIPDVSLSYFDTKEREYKTISCEGFEIQVEKGNANSEYAKQLDQRAKYRNMDIKNPSFLYEKGKEKHIFDKAFVYCLPLILVVLLVVSILLYSRYLNSIADIVNTKKRRATRVAVRRLRKAKKLLNASKYEEFENEISVSLWNYLLDRFKINKAEFSLKACKEKLLQENISQTTVDNMEDVFNRCEYIRFSQDKGANADKKLYDDTINVITSMEEEMKTSKKTKKTLMVGLVLLLLSGSVYCQNLEKANHQYNIHNYDSALVLYQQASKITPSASAYSGMGACYFRLSDYANSVLYYEKALKLSPTNKDIQLNINIVRSRLMGDSYVMAEFLPIRILKNISKTLSLTTWAVLFVCLFVVFCIAFFMYRFTEKKVLYFYVFLFSLILSLSSMGFGILRQNIQNDTSYAIIFTQGIKMKSSQSSSSKDIMTLYKGQKVRIINDESSRWTKIMTTDRREGYIESKSFKRI